MLKIEKSNQNIRKAKSVKRNKILGMLGRQKHYIDETVCKIFNETAHVFYCADTLFYISKGEEAIFHT